VSASPRRTGGLDWATARREDASARRDHRIDFGRQVCQALGGPWSRRGSHKRRRKIGQNPTLPFPIRLCTTDVAFLRKPRRFFSQHRNIAALSPTLWPPLSPLCSQRRVADDTNHLTRFGCGRKAALCTLW
jgi:hypothetical protein